jgi:hypothetical protein
MTDLDYIADLDPLTGLPVVDTRTTATRWLDCLHHGPEFHGAAHIHLKQSHTFDAGSVEQQTQTKPTPPVTAPRAHLITCIPKNKLRVE